MNNNLIELRNKVLLLETADKMDSKKEKYFEISSNN